MLRRFICQLSAAILLAIAMPAFAADVMLGLGYDRARDGHGFDLHKLGNHYILYFYTYDRSGAPEWYLGVAEMDKGVLAGEFERYEYDEDRAEPLVRDWSFDGEFRLEFTMGASAPACQDGTARNNAKQLSEFSWRIEGESGTWCTEFLATGNDYNEDPYHGGVWYAGEADTGYGFTMTHMGDRVSALAYYYDKEGQPRWALGSDSADAEEISLKQYSGYCRTCTKPSRTLIRGVGKLSLGWRFGVDGHRHGEAELSVSYPDAPFGDFNRFFALHRISDGEPMGWFEDPEEPPQGTHYAVTWQEDRHDDDDEEVIASSRFGAPDAERNVNVTHSDVQARPSIAVAADGSYVVTWEDDQDGNDYYQVHARVLNADGSERVRTFTVNSYSAGQQRRPDVAMTPAGDFVIVWEDDQDDNGFYDIHMRGFNADGSEWFSQRQANTEAAANQFDPAIAMDDEGNFVVAWADDQNANEFYEVAIKGFWSDASVRFEQRFANAETAGQQIEPDIAMAPNGEFVVVWTDDSDLNMYTQIHHRLFDAHGRARYSVQTTNHVARASQTQPSVAMATDGSFTATWVDQDTRIVTRSFSRGGSALTGDVALNLDRLMIPMSPSIGIAGDGRRYVVWSQLRSDGLFRLLGRTVNEHGEMGREFIVSAVPGGSQTLPAIAVR